MSNRDSHKSSKTNQDGELNMNVGRDVDTAGDFTVGDNISIGRDQVINNYSSSQDTSARFDWKFSLQWLGCAVTTSVSFAMILTIFWQSSIVSIARQLLVPDPTYEPNYDSSDISFDRTQVLQFTQLSDLNSPSSQIKSDQNFNGQISWEGGNGEYNILIMYQGEGACPTRVIEINQEQDFSYELTRDTLGNCFGPWRLEVHDGSGQKISVQFTFVNSSPPPTRTPTFIPNPTPTVTNTPSPIPTIVPTPSIVLGEPSLLLFYDLTSFYVQNITQETFNSAGITFIAINQDGTQTLYSFATDEWIETRISPNGCSGIDSSIQGNSLPNNCDGLNWVLSSSNANMFWLSRESEGITRFEVRYNGILVKTCATVARRCLVALPE